MRCSTAARRGRDACQQPMVPAEGLEAQMAAYVGGMQLPAAYVGEVVAELRRRQEPDCTAEARRLEREIERWWRRLFVLGEIDEAELKARTEPLHRSLETLCEPPAELDVEKALTYLRDVGRLWADSPRECSEVFEGIEVRGKEITSITPKAVYVPMFVLDRRERFGQTGPKFCNMAPRVNRAERIEGYLRSRPSKPHAGQATRDPCSHSSRNWRHRGKVGSQLGFRWS